MLTQDGATTVVSNLAYPDATDYLDLPAGSYDLKVCANADTTVCPLDPAALELEAGQLVQRLRHRLARRRHPDRRRSASMPSPPPATDTLAPAQADAAPTASPMPLVALGVASLAGLAGAFRAGRGAQPPLTSRPLALRRRARTPGRRPPRPAAARFPGRFPVRLCQMSRVRG